MEQRLGKNIVDHKALQLISKRVAKSSGDARHALDITSNAVGKVVDMPPEEKLAQDVKHNDECMPLVKLPHMMRAIRESMPMRHADIIAGFRLLTSAALKISASVEFNF